MPLFWNDLTTANLVEGSWYPSHLPNCAGPSIDATETLIGQYIPPGKIGYGTYVHVYEVNATNWYMLSAITTFSSSTSNLLANATIPVYMSYSVDNKIDDVLPTTGRVVAVYINNSKVSTTAAPNTALAGGTSSSCYDTTTGTYSVTVNGGTGPNCALSFQMQGAGR